MDFYVVFCQDILIRFIQSRQSILTFEGANSIKKLCCLLDLCWNWFQQRCITNALMIFSKISNKDEIAILGFLKFISNLIVSILQENII